MNGNVIRTITIRGQAEGLDKLTADINKLAAAQENVAVVSEQSAKRVLSLEAAWKKQTLRLDEAARAQANIARETKLADAALREGVATQAQHAKQLELINQRYAQVSQGAQTYGKTLQQGTGETRLARHELINLSRQIQDVGVGLASGQSPLTVLVQQGTQIADVFATSSGTIGGFFRQVGTGAAGFLRSATGIATGVAAIGTSIGIAAYNFGAAQREIEKSLSSIGIASGVTRDQINQIATATATWGGLSTGQARDAATAFAATGQIYEQNVKKATEVTDAFSRAGGDASKMTKELGAALQNPAAGALELNKAYGFLNVTTLEHIRALQAQGKLQEAQAVLLDALLPKIQQQEKYVGSLTQAWNIAYNAIANAADAAGKASRRAFEGVTGIEAGGFSDKEQLGRARGRVSDLQERIGASGSAMQAMVPQSVLDALRAAEAEVARLEQAIAAADQAARNSRLDRLGTLAAEATQFFIPLRAQIEAAQTELNKLREAEKAGAWVDPAALAIGAARVQQLQQQADLVLRQADEMNRLAVIYPGITFETAKQLELLGAQLGVAQARTEQEKIIAQEKARIVQLTGQNLKLEEATRIAAGERAVAEAELATSRAKQSAAQQDNLDTSQDIRSTHRAIGQEIQRNTQYTITWGAAFGSLSTAYRRYRLDLSQAIEDRLSDWPAGLGSGNTQYTVDMDILGVAEQMKAMQNIYGAQNVEMVKTGLGWNAIGSAQLTKDYIAGTTARIAEQQKKVLGDPTQVIGGLDISSPSAIQTSFERVLAFGLKDGLSNINRLIDAVSDPATQIGLIQQTIGYIQAKEQPGLARDEMIQDLNSKLEQLTNSTDSLNNTMQQALSPFYSQDPRTTKLGFRAGTVGNPDWMTGATNANPLVAVLGQGATAPGMANGGSFVVGGGYSANDNRMAMFPVASGEQVVVNRSPQGRGGQVINIDNRIIVTGSVDADTLSKMKVSRYQQAQKMRAGMARG